MYLTPRRPGAQGQRRLKVKRVSSAVFGAEDDLYLSRYYVSFRYRPGTRRKMEQVQRIAA